MKQRDEPEARRTIDSENRQQRGLFNCSKGADSMSKLEKAVGTSDKRLVVRVLNIVLLVLMVFSFVSGMCFTQSAQYYYEQGVVYDEEGMLDEAIVQYKIAITINPSHADAHNNLGVDYGKKGMFDEAIAEFNKVLEVNPNDDVAHSNLGMAYLNKRMFDEAIDEFNKTLEINPNNVAAHGNLGTAFGGKEMYDEAIAQWKTALSIDPNFAPAHMGLAIIHYYEGQYGLAIKHYDTAMELGFEDYIELGRFLDAYREKSEETGSGVLGIFQFLVYLGVVQILFGFIWKWVFVLPISFLFAVLKMGKGAYFVKALGTYLLVSLTARLVLISLSTPIIFQGRPPGSLFLVLPFIGGFVLYMGLGKSSYEAHKQAMTKHDYVSLKMLQYDGFFIIGALLLYVVVLFAPSIATNPLTQWLVGVMEWIYNLPVVGWLVAGGAIIFLISIIWHGILFSLLPVGWVVAKIKRKPTRT